MTDEIDISRSAQLFVQEHGERALVKAVERYLELVKQDDTEGALIWRRIITAVDLLLRKAHEG